MLVEIQRTRRKSHFTVVANSVARDKNLSLRARGLLLLLLSYPDDWRTSTLAISYEVKEGRDAVRNAAKELEAAGYLIRSRSSDEKGRWSTKWLLYDEPGKHIMNP